MYTIFESHYIFFKIIKNYLHFDVMMLLKLRLINKWFNHLIFHPELDTLWYDYLIEAQSYGTAYHSCSDGHPPVCVAFKKSSNKEPIQYDEFLKKNSYKYHNEGSVVLGELFHLCKHRIMDYYKNLLMITRTKTQYFRKRGSSNLATPIFMDGLTNQLIIDKYVRIEKLLMNNLSETNTVWRRICRNVKRKTQKEIRSEKFEKLQQSTKYLEKING